MSTPGPRLHGFNLVVTDMAASVRFYELLGLTIPPVPPEWEDHHRIVDVGDGLDFDLDSIAFAGQWNEGWPERAGGPMGVLGLEVDSRDEVDETHRRVVAAGYAVQQPPYDTFWGVRYAIVEDPDGNAVGIMSPPDPARRFPPTPPS